MGVPANQGATMKPRLLTALLAAITALGVFGRAAKQPVTDPAFARTATGRLVMQTIVDYAEYIGGFYVLHYHGITEPQCDSVMYISRWNDTAWKLVARLQLSQPQHYIRTVNAMALYRNNIYVGGYFQALNAIPGTAGIAVFADNMWRPLPHPRAGIIRCVLAMCAYRDELYVSCSLEHGNRSRTNQLLAWNGTQWRTVVETITGGYISALAEYGGDMLATGSFSSLDGMPFDGAATMRDSAWQPMSGKLVQALHRTTP